MKKHYEHDTLLFKKKDNTKLKTKVTVGAPARQNFAETFDENEANKTIIEYRARSDDQQDRDRDEIIWREFPWDGVARDVSTEVFNLSSQSCGKNTIHTDDAIQY
ncbi:MAG: hypothetical protein K8R86_11840 [Bacteroidales bacterium]|nr:hypothetical protein [Bacteroidales bacterium]